MCLHLARYDKVFQISLCFTFFSCVIYVFTLKATCFFDKGVVFSIITSSLASLFDLRVIKSVMYKLQEIVDNPLILKQLMSVIIFVRCSYQIVQFYK